MASTGSEESTNNRYTLYLSGINPEKPNPPAFRWLLLLVAAACIILGLFEQQTIFRVMYFLFGGLIAASVAYLEWFYKPNYLSFDEQGFKGQIQRNAHIQYVWDDIKQINVDEDNRIEIIPKDHANFIINFNNLPYQQQEDIAPKFFSYAQQEGIFINR